MSRPGAVGSAVGQLYIPKSSKCRPGTSPLLLCVTMCYYVLLNQNIDLVREILNQCRL